MQIGSPRSCNVRCSISCFLLRNPRNCQERSGFGYGGYDANLGTDNYGNSVGMRFNGRPPADEWAWQNRKYLVPEWSTCQQSCFPDCLELTGYCRIFVACSRDRPELFSPPSCFRRYSPRSPPRK